MQYTDMDMPRTGNKKKSDNGLAQKRRATSMDQRNASPSGSKALSFFASLHVESREAAWRAVLTVSIKLV